MSNQPEERYEDSQLYRIRHSAAHVMAQAVLEFYPETKYTIGPPVENGFYYDFDLPQQITLEDLEKIEKRMRQIIAGGHAFVKKVVSAEEARQVFKDQPYKLELIDGLEKGELDEYGNPLAEKPEISLYQSDTFTDLCRGPHVETTRQINPSAFKLMSIAGAYWRGDEHNKMLTRIYGTAWKTPDELKNYLKMLEEAKARDHRKLGKELEIYIYDEEVGPGLPLWLPRGGVVIEELERLAKEMEEKAGYLRVRTPAPDQGRPVPALRSPAVLRREHVPAHGDGRNEILRQADELPDAPQDLRREATLLPRPAHPAGRIRHLLPLRKIRRAVRADARPLDADERCAHLRDRGSVRAGVHGGHGHVQGNISTYSASANIVMRLSLHSKEGLGKKYRGQRAPVAQDGRYGAARHEKRRCTVRGGCQRGRLLWPEDRRTGLERHRARVHSGHQPGGFCPAGPLRPESL